MNWTVLYICDFVIPPESLKFNDGYGETNQGDIQKYIGWAKWAAREKNN